MEQPASSGVESIRRPKWTSACRPEKKTLVVPTPLGGRPAALDDERRFRTTSDSSDDGRRSGRRASSVKLGYVSGPRPAVVDAAARRSELRPLGRAAVR